MGINVGQILRQAALRTPTRTALVDVGMPGEQRIEVDYAGLDAGARKVAALLRERGVQPGQHVGLIAHNSRQFVEAWFGGVYAGCAVMPMPIVSAVPEIAFRLGHARCDVLLADAERIATAEQAAAHAERDVTCLAVEELAGARVSPVPYPADTEAGQTAMILYTSGTAGQPKGAAISHASLTTHTAALVHHVLRLDADDHVLGALPLTHSYGIRMVVLASFFAGARAVLMPRFDAERCLQVMQDEAITWLPAVPTMYAAWANVRGTVLGNSETEPKEDDSGTRPVSEFPRTVPASPTSLRWALSAGAPLADDIAKRAEACLGVEVRQGYGMTEATFSTINAPDDARIFGSVGKPVWGVEARIVDAQGKQQPAGYDGEIQVRGQNAMTGYLYDHEATTQVRQDGWIRTGDVGHLDAEGRLYVVDRIKDMIIRGGVNVYPSEVEALLVKHPDVAEVAVVGKPDDYYGEEVVAVVVLREGAEVTAEALIAWSRQQMARNKAPREVRFVAQLPLGPSRKVLKRVVREWVAGGSGSHTH